MEELDDEMDSLFEGMVLFTPQTSTPTDQKITRDEEPIAESASHPQRPEPEALDENLFSDLTLVSDLQPPTPPPPHLSSSSSRKKKKKAASLRIGYARDDDVDADQTIPITNPSSSINLPPAHSNHLSSRFHRIQSLISDKLHQLHQSAASLSSARKEAISRRRNAALLLNSASFRHADLESQLESACEAEDFESAQRISDSLAASDSERQALLTALKQAEAHCHSVDSQMRHLLDSQIAAEQDCASLLSTFSKNAEADADLAFNKAQSLSSKQLDEWLSSTEALEAKRMELDIQSHIFNQARLLVNTSIDHSTNTYRREREILHQRRSILSDELQRLLALVKAKEHEIAENDANIQAIEEKIADVVARFQDSQSSIDAKYQFLESELSHVHLQSKALSSRRKEIDQFLADEEANEAKLRELARVSQEEANAYQEVVELRKCLMSSILKSGEDRVRLAKMEEKLIEDVQSLKQEVSSARVSLQELSSTKSNIQQNIASFKQRIFFVDKRAPELEAEKKVAAAARNFKEAARIAAEAKSLSVEKDHVQVDSEKATAQLEKLEEDIKNTISRLHDTEQLISSKEKEVGKARLQSLLLIAGAAKAERSAALDLGDTEEASLLLSESEAAEVEAKNLQPLYNFSEQEFLNLPKHFISMELVLKLGRKQLVELAALVGVSTSE